MPPPLLMHRIALALGLPREQALPLAHAGCFYHAAADPADDPADTPAAPATDLEARLGVNDVCVLLLLCPSALIEIPSPHMPALASIFARSRLVMAGGQARDLAFSDTLDAEAPIAIARGKTGGELAALVAAPIVLAGGAPGPWLDFGRALGTLLQVFTDSLDFFAKETDDDWRDAKPTLPIRHTLSHPVHGRAAALLLAGARHAVSRQQAARFVMIEAGTAPHYRVFADARLAAMGAVCEAAGRPAILVTLLAETRELSLAVDDALAALAEVESPPTLVSPDDEAAGCLRAAGRDSAGYAAALGRRDPDGWRYYPGCGEIPPDADLTGLALQMGWHRAQPDDPDVRRAADRLVARFDAPGPPTSAFYGPVVVDALGLLMLTEFGAHHEPGTYASRDPGPFSTRTRCSRCW